MLLLITLQAATVVAIPVPAGPFTLANVAVTGPWTGFGLSLAATVAGSVAAFLLARRYGWALVRRLGGTRVATDPDLSGARDGSWLLPVLCVPIPLGGDVACFLAGISGVRLRRFVVLAALGRTPGTALGALLASGMTTRSAVWLIIGLVGFAVLFTVARYRRTCSRWPLPASPASDTDEVATTTGGSVGHPTELHVGDRPDEVPAHSTTRTASATKLPRPLAFALGAGGSHGAIQVGQLRALGETGIRPDLLVGCSVGALNAAAVAAEPEHAVENLHILWRALRRADVFTPATGPVFHRRALCDQQALMRLAERILPPQISFDDLEIPLHVVATDTATRRTRIISHGPVLPALLASCAVPVVYPAVTIDGHRLIDGGIRHDLPVAEAVELGAACVLALPTTRWPFIGHRASRPVSPRDGTQPRDNLILDGAAPPGTGWTFTRTETNLSRGYQAARAQLAHLHRSPQKKGA